MVRLSRPVCPAGPDARLPARAVTLLAVLLTLLASSPAQADDTDINQLRLHQLQLIGTHNSYHIAPHKSVANLISLAGSSVLQGIEYTHRQIGRAHV